MTLKNKRQTKLSLLMMLLLTTLAAHPQKLPNLQTTSLRAPANVKIDGKATEWNNQFQAYNKTTDIYYTIANDGDNLYLIIKATDDVIIRKIISNSITLSITDLVDKNERSLSLPLFSHTDGLNIASTLYKAKNSGTVEIDSLINLLNRGLDKTKEIKITGVKEITEPFISVYNEMGIKSKGLFDNTKALTYEIAIPKKYLNVRSNKLTYNIRLNGIDDSDKNLTVQLSPDGQSTIRTNNTTGAITVRRNSPETLIETTTTDFSGDYILAK